ncbi:MAG: ABC transporter ATP-binding protein [Dysgonamonadaceae bacterium]
MNAIEVKSLNKYFYEPTENYVLQDIHFSVRKNSLTSITGKSGSGKSTLLYLLSTMDTDFDGHIRINGEDIKGRDRRWLANYRNQNIGFIFQFHFLLPEFSVLDNVMLPALKLAKYSKEEIQNEAFELLRLLGIADQYNKKAALLSGGQQQRVAIARALINNPSLIIGDEPTGNLDSRNTEMVFELFQQLCHEKGQTILIVTHDEDFAERSDAVIHLKDGRIVL